MTMCFPWRTTRKPAFFECAHGVEVTDARDLGQGLDGYFNFANILAPKLLVDD